MSKTFSLVLNFLISFTDLSPPQINLAEKIEEIFLVNSLFSKYRKIIIFFFKLKNFFFFKVLFITSQTISICLNFLDGTLTTFVFPVSNPKRILNMQIWMGIQ